MPKAFVDPTLLRQALTNLVDNAIRYTAPGGRVSIVAYKEDETVLIRVEDTGAGIAPMDQARLFEKFHPKQHEAKNEGSGLGLAIVKRIVEDHNGVMLLEDADPKGAKITLSFEI